jgi:hypothetical protein
MLGGAKILIWNYRSIRDDDQVDPDRAKPTRQRYALVSASTSASQTSASDATT